MPPCFTYPARSPWGYHNGSHDDSLDDTGKCDNKTAAGKNKSRLAGTEAEGDSDFRNELEQELMNSQLKGPVQYSSEMGEDLMAVALVEDSQNGQGTGMVHAGGSSDSIEDAAQLIMMLEMMVEHQKAQTKGPPRLEKERLGALKGLENASTSYSPSATDSRSDNIRNNNRDAMGVTEMAAPPKREKVKSYVTVLNGRKTRDIEIIKGALRKVLADPEALALPTILSKAMTSLDACRAHPNELLAWWKRLTAAGARVNAKALRSLLAQVLNRMKVDSMSVSRAVEIALALPLPGAGREAEGEGEELWSTVSVNLAIQLLIEANMKEQLTNFIAPLAECLSSTATTSGSGV